ncbi:hypothetical protein AAFF_G00389560 [Aldrovandia affinis]|uniref:Uncharacterized protein n=1 Tax=Aldrovandia affinis TaxID=143900 RepID=A0AAD7SEF8_9TELE|nr:hypothetical protein AAFF_G00389560 [Aldrovandia affinis]
MAPCPRWSGACSPPPHTETCLAPSPSTWGRWMLPGCRLALAAFTPWLLLDCPLARCLSGLATPALLRVRWNRPGRGFLLTELAMGADLIRLYGAVMYCPCDSGARYERGLGTGFP